MHSLLHKQLNMAHDKKPISLGLDYPSNEKSENELCTLPYDPSHSNNDECNHCNSNSNAIHRPTKKSKQSNEKYELICYEHFASSDGGPKIPDGLDIAEQKDSPHSSIMNKPTQDGEGIQRTLFSKEDSIWKTTSLGHHIQFDFYHHSNYSYLDPNISFKKHSSNDISTNIIEVGSSFHFQHKREPSRAYEPRSNGHTFDEKKDLEEQKGKDEVPKDIQSIHLLSSNISRTSSLSLSPSKSISTISTISPISSLSTEYSEL